MMSKFANGEQYENIHLSNFGSSFMTDIQRRKSSSHNAVRISDSFVGAPNSRGHLQPTSGHVGFTTGYNGATNIGKAILAAASVATAFAMPSNIVVRGITGALMFYGLSVAYENIKG